MTTLTVAINSINQAMSKQLDPLSNRAWLIVFYDTDTKQFAAYDTTNPQNALRAITSRHPTYEYCGIRSFDSVGGAVEVAKAVRLANTAIPIFEEFRRVHQEALTAAGLAHK